MRRYPVDVEKELDKALDRLCSVRVSSEKWEYFERLVTEINAAYTAGCKGDAFCPIDVGITLAADSEQYGLGSQERRLVSGWMTAINAAYRDGCAVTREIKPPEPVKIIDPETKRVLRRVRNAADLEGCLYSFMKSGRSVCLFVPELNCTATFNPKQSVAQRKEPRT